MLHIWGPWIRWENKTLNTHFRKNVIVRCIVLNVQVLELCNSYRGFSYGILLPVTTDHCWLMFKGGHFPSILNNHDTLRNVLLLWAREGSPLEVIVIPISKSMHWWGRIPQGNPWKLRIFIVQIHKKQNTNASKKIIMSDLFPMHVYSLLACSWLWDGSTALSSMESTSELEC